MTDSITLTVPGRPVPQGSHRAVPIRRRDGTVGVRVLPDSERLVGWRERVAWIASRRIDSPLDGPVSLSIEFRLARPRGHYRTGRHAGRLRPGAPEYPAVRPDLDKLIRAVCDALTGVAWRDDSQVVSVAARKSYSESYETIITVAALGGTL